MAPYAFADFHVKGVVSRLLRPAVVATAGALLTAASAWASQADPVLSAVPQSPTVPVDATSFQVEVFVDAVTNPTGLGGYDLFLNFDPAVIRAIRVTDSGFVLSTGNIVVCVAAYIDNTAGQAILSCVPVPLFVTNGPTATTPQLLATAVFQPVAPGTSSIGLEGTMLSDPHGAPLDVTLQSGQVTIVQASAPSPSPEPALIPATPTLAPPPTEAPLATAAPATAQAPPPAASPQPQPAVQVTPTARSSPQATATRPARTATPTAEPTLPRTGDGSGEGGSSWVFPVAGGLAGAAAVSLAAALGLRAWRQRQGRSATGR